MPSSGKAQVGESSRNARDYDYFVFISYSRKDSQVAKWLQHRFEWFRFPVTLVDQSRHPPNPKYLRPVYRDKTHLEVDHESYWESIKTGIDSSKFLVILCSPDSARSKPVDSEVRQFLASHGGDIDAVLPMIVRGHVGTGDENECLCPALREFGNRITDRNLPTMVPDSDGRVSDGWEAGFIGAVAYLLNLRRQSLLDHVRRLERRKKRFAMALAATFGLLAVAAAVFGVIALKQKRQATKALGDSLYTIGVQMLQGESEHRALPYFASAHAKMANEQVIPELLDRLIGDRSLLIPWERTTESEAKGAEMQARDAIAYHDGAIVVSRSDKSETKLSLPPHEGIREIRSLGKDLSAVFYTGPDRACYLRFFSHNPVAWVGEDATKLWRMGKDVQSSFAASEDGDLVALRIDNTVKIVDTKTWRLVREIELTSLPELSALALLHRDDRAWLLTESETNGGNDDIGGFSVMSLYDAKDGHPIAEAVRHYGTIDCSQPFKRFGKRILLEGQRETLRVPFVLIWALDLETGELDELSEGGMEITRWATSAKGDLIFVEGNRVYRLSADQVTDLLAKPYSLDETPRNLKLEPITFDSPVSDIAISPDSTWLAVRLPGFLRVVRMDTGVDATVVAPLGDSPLAEGTFQFEDSSDVLTCDGWKWRTVTLPRPAQIDTPSIWQQSPLVGGVFVSPEGKLKIKHISDEPNAEYGLLDAEGKILKQIGLRIPWSAAISEPDRVFAVIQPADSFGWNGEAFDASTGNSLLRFGGKSSCPELYLASGLPLLLATPKPSLERGLRVDGEDVARIWNYRTGKILAEIPGAAIGLGNRTGDALFVGMSDGRLNRVVWKNNELKFEKTGIRLPLESTAAQLSSDGKYAAIMSDLTAAKTGGFHEYSPPPRFEIAVADLNGLLATRMYSDLYLRCLRWADCGEALLLEFDEQTVWFDFRRNVVARLPADTNTPNFFRRLGKTDLINLSEGLAAGRLAESRYQAISTAVRSDQLRRFFDGLKELDSPVIDR